MFFKILQVNFSELEVLTDLLATGSLQFVDLTMVEYHPYSFKKNDSRAEKDLQRDRRIKPN